MSGVRGIAFVSIKNYLYKRFPEKEIEKMKEIIDIDSYDILTNCNPKLFYPIDSYIKINKCIVKLFGNMDISILKKIGRYTADEAVRGIYRIFFNFGSPQFIIKKASTIYTKYYDEGMLSVVDIDKNSVTLELFGLKSVKNEQMKYVCLLIEGWLERAAEISAGKSAVTIQEKCRYNNDEICKFIIKW